VLFAHNATVGPVAILHTDEEKVILSTSLTYYRCNPNHILAEYLAHYMRSHEFKKQYLQVMRQSTRNQVPITKQREFFHIIPPLEDQERIVGVLDGLLDNSQRLTRLYECKLTALEELKKSLLHQAFNGEL
jgi:type I restriction enzyme S subunit